jgi:hypothetical protein
MYDLMIEAFADALGMTADEIEAQLLAGETIYQIAVYAGYDVDTFPTLMQEVHAAVVDKALAEGLITEEQAEWMKEKSSGMSSGLQMGYSGSLGSGAYGEGFLHEYMDASLAGALGLSEEDFETRREAGETFFQIAQDLGFDADAIREILVNAREAAFEQAKADGVIPEDFKGGRPSGSGYGGRHGPGGCWSFGDTDK